MSRSIRRDVVDQLTVFVTTVGDTTNFTECMERLEIQSAVPRIEVLTRLSPMCRAFQAMIDRCATPYYIQLDEDMLLHQTAVATLLDRISKAAPRVAFLCGPLWDVDADRPIYGVKIFRHRIVVDYPFENTFGCDMDQVRRLQADGFEVAFLPMVEDSSKALGEHGQHYTPQTAFRRWKRLVQKHRRYGRMDWIEPYHLRHLSRWRETGDPVHLGAVLGMVAGLVGELPPDEGADYRSADPDWERLWERYLPGLDAEQLD